MSSSPFKKLIVALAVPPPKSIAWSFIFIPALLYFVVTRFPISSRNRILYGMEYGIPISTSIVTIEAVYTTQTDNNSNGIINNDNQLLKVFQLTKSTTTPPTINSDDDDDDDDINRNDGHSSNPSFNTTKRWDLRYPLQLIYEIPIHQQSHPNHDNNSNNSDEYSIRDIIYRYDSAIGRGYILYTTSFSNRIWRFEIGHGLFPIGNTLFMDHACCRSKSYCSRSNNNSIGSISSGGWCGPLALEYEATTVDDKTGAQQQQDGKLIIAEYGEERIIRLEEEYGARTPLMTHMPRPGRILRHDNEEEEETPSRRTCTNSQQLQQRLANPDRLLYTSQGHLLLVINDFYVGDDGSDNEEGKNSGECPSNDATNTENMTQPSSRRSRAAAIVLVPNTVHTPPLTTLQQSRDAHYWNATMMEQYVGNSSNHRLLNPQQQHVYYSNPYQVLWIGDIAISSDGRTLYGIAEIVPTTDSRNSSSTASTSSLAIVIFKGSMKPESDDIDIDDDDDDEEGGNVDHRSNKSGQKQEEMTILLELSKYYYYDSSNDTSREQHINDGPQQPQQRHRPASISMVMSQQNILYVTVPDGVLFIDPIIGRVIGQLHIPPSLSSSSLSVADNYTTGSTNNIENGSTQQSLSHPTAMTLGGDGYLHIAANRNNLYRIRTNDLPVVFIPKKKARTITTKNQF